MGLQPTGNLLGHVGPGLGLLLWALPWLAAFARPDAARGQTPLEPTRWSSWAKLAAVPIGVFAHVPTPASWSSASVAMAWQHASMFLPFGLSGIVDLLVRARRIDVRASYGAASLALAVNGLLFLGHGNPAGLEGTAHLLIGITFALAAGGAALECGTHTAVGRCLRIGGVLCAGIWFIAVGWLLYLSGWDLADHVSVMWAYSLFSWCVVASGAALVIAASLRSRRA